MRVVNPRGPHHAARCLGSVQAWKTSSRGASKVRASSNWPFTANGRLAAALLFAGFADMRFLLFLLLHCVQIFVQAVEAILPEPPVMFEPAGSVLERPRFEPTQPPLRGPAACDQPRPLQNLQVLRDRR